MEKLNNEYDANNVKIFHLDNGFSIVMGDTTTDFVVEIRSTEERQYVNMYCVNNDKKMCLANIHAKHHNGEINLQVTSYKNTKWFWVIKNASEELKSSLEYEIGYIRKYKKELLSRIEVTSDSSESTTPSPISVALNKINQLYKAGKLNGVRGKNSVLELMKALDA